MMQVEEEKAAAGRPTTEKTTTQPKLEIPKSLDELSAGELRRKILTSKIMTRTLNYLANELVGKEFEWLLPVVFSKMTDPLWPDPGASIEKRIEVEIYGETVRTTASMIIHKMFACSLAYPKLFVLSPNVRIEKRERQSTGWHAYEFTQLDFEVRNASSKQIFRLVEGWISGLIRTLRRTSKEELSELGSYQSIRVPAVPFKVYDAAKLKEKLGAEWEKRLASEIADPVWVTNIPREFYDFQDFESDRWDNYDLFVPKYGEILSGAKREHEYQKISSKIERDGVKSENYALLLKLAQEGRIKPSAGGGIGVERLVAWLSGAKHIGEASPFPKTPGVVYQL
jgi:asparaginyl-tRNA synthetase